MFYERYLRLCNAKGVKPSTAATEAGFNRGTVSVWKKKCEAGIDVTPDQETIDKICTYFGCSEQWLRGIKNAPSNFGERVNDADLDDNYAILSRNARNMSPENRAKLVEIAKMMFEDFKEDPNN